MSNSEVARLLEQISAEYKAAEQGLIGLSLGAAQHAFITARTEHISQLHQELQTLVGSEAIALIAQQLDGASEELSQIPPE